MESILIKKGTVIPCDGRRQVLKNTDVLIQDGKIAQIGEVKQKADIEIDARQKAVLPGLINAHTHLAMVLFRGVADDMELIEWLEQKIWPMELHLTADHVYWGAMLGCLEMIKSGTTCFADQYFFMDRVAKAVKESGIRGVLSYGIIELGDPERRKSEIVKGTELVQKFHGKANGRILTMYGPHAPYTCSKECLLEVKELARKHNVGIHIHVSESEGDIKNTIEFQGERPIKFLEQIGFLGPEVLAAHCVKVNDEEMRILKQRNVKIAHNPVSNLKLASGIAPIARYLREGITVGIGTDGAASNNNLDMFEEMKICSLIAKVRENNPTVVNTWETLEMATIGGAKALRLENEIGSIEVGKKADIILVNLRSAHLAPMHDVVSHLVYAANGGDVSDVICDGQIIMKDRQVLTMDESLVLSRAQEMAMDLVERAG